MEIYSLSWWLSVLSIILGTCLVISQEVVESRVGKKDFKRKVRKHAFDQEKKEDSSKKERKHANDQEKKRKKLSYRPRKKASFRIFPSFFYKFSHQEKTIND